MLQQKPTFLTGLVYSSPVEETLVLLKGDQITTEQFDLLEFVFCHVIRQKSYVTVLLSGIEDEMFLSTKDVPLDPDDYDNECDRDKQEKLTAAVRIILEYYSTEFVTWENSVKR
jgi:hypothetical protein